MSVKRVVPNISSNRVDESRDFFTAMFGFEVVMDMGWIVTLASPCNPTAQISVVRGETADPAGRDMTLSIEVEDVDEIHSRAIAQGRIVVYPLTNEPWGVRRFHVKDPNGVVINVLSHLE